MKFGSFTFPTGWYCSEDSDEQTVPLVDIPRRDGAAFLSAQRKQRNWTVMGAFILGDLGCTDVRVSLDTIKAALLGNGAQNFYLDTDRYWRNVQAQIVPTKHDAYYRLYCELQVKLLGPDPFQYSTATTTTAELIAAGSPYDYLSTLGNAYALPQWYIKGSAALNSAFGWVLTNTTTGEVAHLSGAWPGSTDGYFIIDSLAQTVQFAPSLGGTAGPADANLSSAVAGMGYFEGQFPRLSTGNNGYTLTHTGVAPAGLWAVFNGRWL